VFQEQIAVIGVDPPGSTTGTVVTSFVSQTLPVTDHAVQQTIAHNRSLTVTRALPHEDTPDAFTDEELQLG
jgi:hypothetical protein